MQLAHAILPLCLACVGAGDRLFANTIVSFSSEVYSRVFAGSTGEFVPQVVSEAVREAKEASESASDAVDKAERSVGRYSKQTQTLSVFLCDRGHIKLLKESLPQLSSKADDAEKRAKKALKTAEDAQKKAEEPILKICCFKVCKDHRTYEAYEFKEAPSLFRVLRRREVERLETDATGYYQSYLSDLKLARVQEDIPQVEAIKKSKQPYTDAEEQVDATVESYNSCILRSFRSETRLSCKKAHKLMHMAKEKKVRALKVRALAERLNSNVLPAYRQAVKVAGVHAAFGQSQHLRKN
eukprot:g3826.t1